MPKQKTVYARHKMDKWKNLTIDGVWGSRPLQGPLGSCGCILVYENREAFDREHPDEKPLILTIG